MCISAAVMGTENCFTNSYNLLNNSMTHWKKKKKPDGHWHWGTDPKADLVFPGMVNWSHIKNFWKDYHKRVAPCKISAKSIPIQESSVSLWSRSQSWSKYSIWTFPRTSLVQPRAKSWHPLLRLDPKQTLSAGPFWIAALQVLLTTAMFGLCWTGHSWWSQCLSVTATSCWPLRHVSQVGGVLPPSTC